MSGRPSASRALILKATDRDEGPCNSIGSMQTLYQANSSRSDANSTQFPNGVRRPLSVESSFPNGVRGPERNIEQGIPNLPDCPSARLPLPWTAISTNRGQYLSSYFGTG